MKKRTLLISLASMTLAVITAVSVFRGSTSVYAASNKYLEDFIIVNASSDDEARIKTSSLDGYELLSGTLSSHGNNKKYVACKYTNDSKKALTDIRAMNMKGGFSSEAYERVMENKKDETEEIVDSLYDSVLALKDNYQTSKTNKDKKGVDGFIYAYDLLSYYTYDDLINSQTKSPYTVAELLTSDLSKKEMKNHLKTIVMEGNSKCLSGIEMALMHAASSESDALDLEELGSEDTDYNDYEDGEYEQEAAYMAGGVETIQSFLRPFTNCAFDFNNTDDPDYDAKLQDYLRNCGSQESTGYYNGFLTYLALSSYSYHHDGITENLAEFFLNLDTDAEDFDNKIFYPFAAGLNESQAGCLPFAGLDTLIISSLYRKLTEKNHSESQSFFLNYDSLDQILLETAGSGTTISVFESIDRSVFTSNSVALTNSALQQNNSKNDFNWFSDEKAQDAKTAALMRTILTYSAITSAASFLIAGVTYFYLETHAWYTVNYLAPEIAKYGLRKAASLLFEEIAFAESDGTADVFFLSYYTDMATAKSLATAVSVGFKIIATFMTIAFIALATFIVALILFKIYEHLSERTTVDYDDIPEIMVDEELVDDEAVYTTYHVVKDEKGEAQTVSFYEEANETQWVTLYKTTDTKRGTPILASDVRLTGFDSKDNEEDFTAVKKFGETSKYNVKTFCGNGGQKLYLGYKNSELSNAASIFSNGIGLPIIFLVLGLVFGATGGIFSYKFALKKKEEALS